MQEVFMNATFILEHIKRASYNLIRFLCWDETLNDVWELCICSSVHHNLRFRLRYRISPWKINCHLSSGNDFRRLFSKFWAIVSYITPINIPFAGIRVSWYVFTVLDLFTLDVEMDQLFSSGFDCQIETKPSWFLVSNLLVQHKTDWGLP